MKSGLGDRNNGAVTNEFYEVEVVSMKSGLGDRNNPAVEGTLLHEEETVSMKSGLGDRNNLKNFELEPRRRRSQ